MEGSKKKRAFITHRGLRWGERDGLLVGRLATKANCEARVNRVVNGNKPILRWNIEPSTSRCISLFRSHTLPPHTYTPPVLPLTSIRFLSCVWRIANTLRSWHETCLEICRACGSVALYRMSNHATGDGIQVQLNLRSRYVNHNVHNTCARYPHDSL